MIWSKARFVAGSLWVMILVLTIVGVSAIVFLDWGSVRTDFRPDSSDAVAALPILAFATVGLLIEWSNPRNRIGWLLTITAIAAAFIGLNKMYAGFAIDLHHSWLPGPLWVYQVGRLAWIVTFAAFLMVLPLLYPDGRLPGRRWRIVLWLVGVNVIVAMLTDLDPASHAKGIVNPIGVEALKGISNLIELPFVVLFLVTALAAVASLFVRYRRAGERERQQLKWLMGAAGFVFVIFAASILLPLFENGLFVPIAVTAMPIAIGIAILRYRLYDIDFIINKALVYGGLAVLITAVYVLVVVGIGAVVGS